MNKELIEQYKELHSKSKSYGNGATYPAKIVKLCHQHKCKTALDFGCGKGALANFMNLTGVKTDKYDPAIEGINKITKESYDMVVANDVLEHLHPDDYNEDIKGMMALANKAVFLNISCRPAVFKLPNGENCHTIVRDKDWWIALFSLYKEWEINYHRFGEKGKNLELFLLKK